jgi:hypothetical protein
MNMNITIMLQLGKNIVRWFVFENLKSPHLRLAKILVIVIIIKL